MIKFKNLRTGLTTSQFGMQKHEDAVYQLDNQLQSTLDVVAPLITKKIKTQKTMVWQTTQWPKENTQK